MSHPVRSQRKSRLASVTKTTTSRRRCRCEAACAGVSGCSLLLGKKCARIAGWELIMKIAACYTYPVKGMTTHSMPSLELRPGESVVGDRAFIFAFGNAEIIGAHGWVSKRQSVTMLNTPYLPWIESGWDPEARVLSVTVKGQTKSAQVDDAASRVELSDWMTDVVLGLPENPLRGRPEREPLRLLGEGESRFTDRGPTQISLGGLVVAGRSVGEGRRRCRYAPLPAEFLRRRRGQMG